MATLLLWVIMGGFALFVGYEVFKNFDFSVLDGPVWIAMILGGVLSFAAAGLLMWLVFHSARSGHDDRVGVYDPNDKRQP